MVFYSTLEKPGQSCYGLFFPDISGLEEIIYLPNFYGRYIILNEKVIMVVKCAAGSLESREREVVSAARIFTSYQIPYAVVSDGKTAVIYDTITGKKESEGLDGILSREEAMLLSGNFNPVKISDKRIEKEKIIFRSYDTMNVNVRR